MVTQVRDPIDRQKIITTLESIFLRAEKVGDIGNILRSYVQIVDLDVLQVPNTQIIYGRHGTGKTHLFKAFYTHCETDFVNTKILPVYIDCRDLDLGTGFISLTPDQLVLRFYRHFLRGFILRLREFADRTITPSVMDRIFKSGGQARIKQISEKITNLNTLLDPAHIEERLESYSRKITLESEDSAKVSGKTRLSAGLSITKPELGIDSSVEATGEELEKEKETIERIYSGLSVVNYSAIREDLEAIIGLCGAKQIILLVDEWSDVSLDVQPYLAEMLRKTLSNSEKITLKIAARKYSTKTSRRIGPNQSIGLQPGVDIVQLANLDDLINYEINSEYIVGILTYILYNHAAVNYPLLIEYSIDEFADYICNQIFENASVYQEVVRASEGNPRDFMGILAACCKVVKQKQDKRITRLDAYTITSNYFTIEKVAALQGNPEANDLFERIFNMAIKNKTKWFLVSSKVADEDIRIQELWFYRFIHLINPSFTYLFEDSTTCDYAVFSIDYGKLISMKVTSRGEQIVRIMDQYFNLLSKLGVSQISIPSKIVTMLLEMPEMREPLRKSIGIYTTRQNGVEKTDLREIEYLVSNCVIDNLL